MPFNFPIKTLTDWSNETGNVAQIEHILSEAESESDFPDYSIEQAMKDLFISSGILEKILRTAELKKNIVLQGPPGVGKTWVAKKLGYAISGVKSDKFVEMIQFHQSYSYEDFIQGYRPNDSGVFEKRNGVFYDFCERARSNPNQKFVFIIDEINRGNLSKIFGELLMLIEADKRGDQHSIQLTYSSSQNERFSVPENVYLLGLMNTADRGLVSIDYALRRRFAFFDLWPEFNSPNFRAHLLSKGVSAQVIEKITERMTALNDRIAQDRRNLGPGFVIGHSYFCPSSELNMTDQQWFETVVELEIHALLNEYWSEDPELVAEEIKKLVA